MTISAAVCPPATKKFGEAQAILAGDCLLTYAFNLMLQVRSAGVPSDLLLTAIDQVAWSAGIKGMIVGQVLDMAAEEGEVSLPELQLIHAYKTGALFKAALCSGGILGGADAGQLAALTTFAEEFGLAFQITDDILDVVGDEQKLGKPVGSDAKNHKTTYPTLVGLAQIPGTGEGSRRESRRQPAEFRRSGRAPASAGPKSGGQRILSMAAQRKWQ